MDFLIPVIIVLTFIAGLVAGFIIYFIVNKRAYGNIENRMQNTMHNFIEEENKNLLNTSTVAFKTALEKERMERENSGLQLNSLINPLKESIKEYQSYIESIEKDRKTESGSLKDNLDTLAKKINDLEHDTIKLSGALRNPSIRGKWGEITLKRTVEIAGMVPYCDFIEQVVSPDRTMRPDMVIKLPNSRNIIVDSKVPLSGYFEYMDGEDNKEELEKYVTAFNIHVRELASKKYWEKFNNSVDFVVMFLPVESLLSIIMDKSPDIIEDAVSKHVIIATPITLISLLLTVHMGWKDANTVKNYNELVSKIRDFYSNLKNYIDDYNDVSKHLEKSVDAFNKFGRDLEMRLGPIIEDLLKTETIKNIGEMNLDNVQSKVSGMDGDHLN
ncbi:MAG: DNA recombination protein RmuC [Ferroplasma sp.]